MNRQAMRGMLVALTAFGLATGAPAAAQWSVKRDSGTGQCLLESETQTATDGYQPTTVRLIVDAQAVRAVAKSVLDPGFSDIGLVVDGKDFIPVDRIDDQRSAIFEKQRARIVEQFIRGRAVAVRLRYWPTWPATGVHPVTFSLAGFTAAHTQLAECR